MVGDELRLHLQLPHLRTSIPFYIFKTPMCDPATGRPDQLLIRQQRINDDLLVRITALQIGYVTYFFLSFSFSSLFIVVHGKFVAVELTKERKERVELGTSFPPWCRCVFAHLSCGCPSGAMFVFRSFS
jgi:hypothetical protein